MKDAGETAGAAIRMDAIVVGAGFAGLYMLHRLRGLGLTAKIFEAGSGVGGTWFWNRYPGARCDVESLQYSYSFSDELQQDWDWSEKYAAQPEILNYINHVTDRFDLRRSIRFSTRVVGADFDDRSGLWTVATDRGDTVVAQYLIMATGCLSVARPPAVAGLDSFAGETYYTYAWPHERIDFTGKRVGLIGTGSTGIQIVPELARDASQLTVFQRTPNFSVPARNGPMDAEYQRSFKRRYREIREEAKFSGLVAPFGDKPAMEVSPQERLEAYELCWERGGITFLRAFTDILTSEESNESVASFIRAKIACTVADPDVAAALLPLGHPFGSKRLCVDTGYYETYNRPNVTLIDIGKTPIETITPAGVKTSKAQYDLDCLVFATGFDAMTGALLAIDIKGQGGRRLREKWKDGPSTYLGLMTSGFPNMFTITGPGSPSVLTNVVVSIEQHVDWLADCIGYMRDRGVAMIDASPEAEAAWGEHVNELASRTLHHKANSWYMGANIPGKPRVFLPYAGKFGDYRRKCDEVAASGYQGFTLTADEDRSALVA